MERVVKALNSAQSPLHWAALGGLLAIAVIIRIATFQGYCDLDPRFYAVLANDLAQGKVHVPERDEAPVFPLRAGVYAPTAASIRMFGVSEATLVAYPLLASIFGCLLAYAFARGVGTPLAGLIAFGALAVLPLDVGFASLLYPDVIAALWANLGIGLAWLAFARPKLWQSVLLGVLSGGSFGLSWLCKEAVIYLAPFVAVLAFALHRHARLSARMTCLAAIGAGALAVLLAETAFYTKLAGDPLFHLHAMERNYVVCANSFFNESSPIYGWESGGYAKALVRRLFLKGPIDMVVNPQMSFLPLLALLGAAWARVVRQRWFVLPLIWLISLLLLFNFMTTSFSSYKPLPLMNRYLWPILLPSAVLLGNFLAALLAGDCDLSLARERRFWAVVLMVGFCGISAYELRGCNTPRRHQLERSVAARLGEKDVIYTDYHTAATLVFFRTGTLEPSTATTIGWEKADPRAIPAGAYVLVSRDMIEFLTVWRKYDSPAFVARPPATWKKVWSAGNADLYIVDGK